MTKLEEAKNKILEAIILGKTLEMDSTPEDYQALTSAYSTLVHAEVQLKMVEWQTGCDDDLDDEVIN